MINTRTPRSRSFVFTVNNPEDYRPDLSSFDGLTYGVFQLESGDEGTPHLQGFLHFGSLKSRKGISKLLGGRAFVEPKSVHSTFEQCREYCTKPDGRLEPPVEFGELPKQGKRNDLLELRDAVVSGRTDKDLLCDDKYAANILRFAHITERVRFILSKPRFLTLPPNVILCIGRPGTGKSHWCRENYPNAYYKPPTKWWQGYSGEDVVIFDDFNGSHCSFTDLKLILDKGPYIAEVKGGHSQLTATTFFITSNYHPMHWYASSVYGKHGYEAIVRRITSIRCFRAIGDFQEFTNVREWLTENLNEFEVPNKFSF